MSRAAMIFAAALVVRSHELPQWRSRGWPWVVLACAELLAFAMPTAARGTSIRDLADVSGVASFLRTRPEPARFIAAEGLLPRALGTWQGLEDAGGAGRTGTRYAAWSAAAAASGGRDGSDALRVANVRYLVADAAAPLPALPWRAAHRAGPDVIYEDPEPYPRAWIATEASHAASPTEALSKLTGATPTPRQRARLDDERIDPAARALIGQRPGYWTHRATDDKAASVTYAATSPEESRAAIRGGSGGWLVVSDAFATGWRAMINGQREPLVPAFGVLRAVAIPAGDVEVVFSYVPPKWRYALNVSTAGVAAMLVLLIWSLLRRLRPRAELS